MSVLNNIKYAVIWQPFCIFVVIFLFPSVVLYTCTVIAYYRIKLLKWEKLSARGLRRWCEARHLEDTDPCKTVKLKIAEKMCRKGRHMQSVIDQREERFERSFFGYPLLLLSKLVD